MPDYLGIGYLWLPFFVFHPNEKRYTSKILFIFSWSMVDLSQYPFKIRPLSKEEGGGFLIKFPDFSQSQMEGRLMKRYKMA